MTEDDLPPIFRAADLRAARMQRLFLWLQRVELVSLTLGALLFEISWRAGGLNVTALAGFGLLVIALASRLTNMSVRPEAGWYDARAVAESAKTLAWQFAVGGSAFPKAMEERDARAQFVSQIRSIATGFEALDVPSGPETQVTSGMLALRARPRDDRRSEYAALRVADQVNWYSAKATENRTASNRWAALLVTLEAAAVVMALLRGLDLFDFDWAGVLSAGAAAVIAWRQTKQYSALAEAYAVTSHEVSAIASLIDQECSEEEWADLVHDAEAAFSREHTLWKARRQRSVSGN